MGLFGCGCAALWFAVEPARLAPGLHPIEILMTHHRASTSIGVISPDVGTVPRWAGRQTPLPRFIYSHLVPSASAPRHTQRREIPTQNGWRRMARGGSVSPHISYPERSAKRVSSRNQGICGPRKSHRLTRPRRPKLHSGEISGLVAEKLGTASRLSIRQDRYSAVSGHQKSSALDYSNTAVKGRNPTKSRGCFARESH